MDARILMLGAGLALSACVKTDHSVDRFIDSGQLAQKVKWGIYVDPDGCDVWMADDGIEGYSVLRLDPRTGERVCSGVLPKGYAAGHKRGSPIPDPI
ncbi:MAG: hypothetical protein F9K34_01775 [Albidovulum sp.]|uniref:hypothetical protein n=1 Tax=Albidovulum sp. TaxID=1872424 RepID=UPI001323617D|nr:hypothetical protein [Defluviimonas sp.]KAB2886611.1 MAG: hypothetical protein F9K34_01775 [Defluviimonas sp.]